MSQVVCERGSAVPEKITAVVTCFNVEDKIRRCLESLKWVDELIVVDSFSTDGTVAVAREYTDRLLQHKYENYGAQHRWAVPQATHQWILVVDSDEWVETELAKEIQSLLENGPDCNGYEILRRNIFLGHPIRYCGWQRDTVVRFFHRDRHRYRDMQVHSDVEVEGPVGRLKGCLGHDSYRDLDDYFVRFNRFTRWAAVNSDRKGQKPSFVNLVFRPVFRFIRMYFFQRGFLDGTPGLIVCMLGSLSVFARYARLWEMLEIRSKQNANDSQSPDRRTR